MMWTRFIWFRTGSSDGYEHCNKPSAFIKGREFLDYMNVIGFSKITLLHGVN
jgi:hypothetical protein